MGLLNILAALCTSCAVSTTPQEEPSMQHEINVALNISGGMQLQLTNGDLYEIAPQDQHRAGVWISPFPIDITPSDDPDFPCKLTNRNTGQSLRARLVPAAVPATAPSTSSTGAPSSSELPPQ